MALSRAVVGALFLYVTVSFTGAEVTIPTDSDKTTAGNTIRPWCDVTGGETFDGWYNPQGEKITTDKTKRVHVESDGTRHNLVLQNIDAVTDGGIYQCKGDTIKREFTLNIGFIANPLTKQRLLLNEKGKIDLDAHGYPRPSYTWKKDGNAFNPAAKQGYTLLDDGSIQISKVTVEDEGKYSCLIQQSITTKSVDIDVQVYLQPRIIAGPKRTREVTEGYNTTFKCTATGRPEPKIEWLDANGRLIDSTEDKRFSISGGNLTITGVVKGDTQRSYTCKASNSADPKEQVKSETAVINKVWAAPTLAPVNDQTKNEEEKVTLLCQATSGDNPINVEWKHNGFRFRDQKQESQKSTIVFERVQVENMGLYVCEATNGAKDDNGRIIVVREEANLYVRSPPKLNKQKSTSPVYSYIGNPKSVKVVCEFFGFPLPNITITRNGTVVAKGQSTATYEIQKTEESTFGNFHCSASNKNGNATHKIELKKAGAPEKVNNLKGVPTCKSILVQWDAPSFDGGMPITKYDVKITDENNKEVIARSVDAPATEYNHAKGIKKEAQYNLEVFARSSYPDRGPSVTATTTTTKFCAPSKPSFTNTEKDLKELKLTLTWNKPDSDGGNADITYEVSLVSYEDGIVKQNETVEKTDKLEMELDSRYLKAGRTYYFKVTAINQGGRSEAGSFRVTVSKDAEGGPPDVGARTQDGLSSGVVAAIVIVIILIVLITIDLLCCYFNSCGVFFCCRKTICGEGSADKYESKKSAEMEKLRAENA